MVAPPRRIPPELLSAWEAEHVEFSRNSRWARTHWGSFEPFRGKFVAVGRRQVLGSGDDPGELRSKFAGERGLYVFPVPERDLDIQLLPARR
ncbi:MAG: hypothetical protein KGJ23_05455 [Euryarchaeota archaeon]|nr:hypothetical protein [Euryarchaeota archaeon]MDE1836044.1 hypothetical protein [Euryarchaeota archaeon]MDE1881224.1 hypothetical protein [Euryarchaeota archaeon]MDE2044022.1 hypothetical protein [Thermoplasmata archaeon]